MKFAAFIGLLLVIGVYADLKETLISRADLLERHAKEALEYLAKNNRQHEQETIKHEQAALEKLVTKLKATTDATELKHVERELAQLEGRFAVELRRITGHHNEHNTHAPHTHGTHGPHVTHVPHTHGTHQHHHQHPTTVASRVRRAATTEAPTTRHHHQTHAPHTHATHHHHTHGPTTKATHVSQGPTTKAPHVTHAHHTHAPHTHATHHTHAAHHTHAPHHTAKPTTARGH